MIPQLPPSAQKQLENVLGDIKLTLASSMPKGTEPKYEVMAGGQGFGLVPADAETTAAINANREKLRSLYKKAMEIMYTSVPPA